MEGAQCLLHSTLSGQAKGQRMKKEGEKSERRKEKRWNGGNERNIKTALANIHMPDLPLPGVYLVVLPSGSSD